MTGPPLLGLMHHLDIVSFQSTSYAVCLMAEDQNGLFRPKRHDRVHYVPDERLARQQMQHLGHGRPHARSHACCEDNDREPHAPDSLSLARINFRASRSLRLTSPSEMMNFMPCSTDMSRWRTSDSGMMSRNPAVGLGVVGTKTVW